MQIRLLCGHYTSVNTTLEGEKYWRDAVFLSLPYLINSLPGHVKLLIM